ncbi:pepsin-like aspartic protease [Agrilutibacter solisilvae]|uniref:A1 family peptidase n=1 Tax=Agrilutibacter solisilvae TaxID=2763317 RepID=A0A975ASI0_9GAMM|nr:pepsin-like aspartic protease [Lysobacter solisilvae]QSX78772.1 A1 family peptidase [Lysobacter solisilvae]
MAPTSLRLNTSLAFAKGAYTVTLEFGSQRDKANLLLDTGSSTVVVLPRAYDPARDASLQPTTWAQQINYGQGGWAGPVMATELGLGEGIHARRLASACFAFVQAQQQNFRDYDGLFGLAFGGLNHAHDMSAVLAQRAVEPSLTWPWPFGQADGDLHALGQLVRGQPPVSVTPLFTAAGEAHVVTDKFAMLIRRSLVHVLDDEAALHTLAGDPLNQGVLILGGGEEHQDLYEGPFRNVRLVHELYYNANLISVQVGDQPRIPVPALAADELDRAASNAIFDTGSSFLVLEASVYAAVLDAFGRHDANFPGVIQRFEEAFRTESGLPNRLVDHRDWPDLHFHLEGEDGQEVRLSCTPGDYWQANALHAGQSFFLLLEQLPGWPRQSILGLPLLSGCYCIFDRRGTGVLRVARAQEA